MFVLVDKYLFEKQKDKSYYLKTKTIYHYASLEILCKKLLDDGIKQLKEGQTSFKHNYLFNRITILKVSDNTANPSYYKIDEAYFELPPEIKKVDEKLSGLMALM